MDAPISPTLSQRLGLVLLCLVFDNHLSNKQNKCSEEYTRTCTDPTDTCRYLPPLFYISLPHLSPSSPMHRLSFLRPISQLKLFAVIDVFSHVVEHKSVICGRGGGLVAMCGSFSVKHLLKEHFCCALGIRSFDSARRIAGFLSLCLRCLRWHQVNKNKKDKKNNFVQSEQNEGCEVTNWTNKR